jgi:uncharacterized protein
MKIFMTGGTGLIGRAFIDHRLTHSPNDYICVLSRNKAAAKQVLPASVNIIDNLADVSFVDFDVIINLAGEPIVNKRWSDQQKQTLCNSRWQLTEQIANKINKERESDNPIRFISGSAVGIYGRQPTGFITEAHKHFYPEFSHTLCQRWEDTALTAKHASTALLRTGIVLSPNGGALGKMLLPFKLGLGGPIGNGKHFMPWIHIEDMIRGIDYLIEHPVLTGPFNFTAPHPVTNKEFSKTLAKSLRRPCLFPVPKFVMRLAMGEMADLVLYGQQAVPQKLLDAGFTFTFSEIAQAMPDVVSKA